MAILELLPFSLSCLLTTAPTLRHLIAIYVLQLRRMLFALTGTCCNLVLIVFFIETSAWLNCFPFSCSVVCSIEGHKQCKEEYNAQYRNRVLRQNIWGLVGSFAAHNLPARLFAHYVLYQVGSVLYEVGGGSVVDP